MAEPLEYRTPTASAPARHSVMLFLTLFVFAAFVSSYATDRVGHWWVGKPSDGGCFLIGLWLIVPSFLAFMIAKAALWQRLPLSPFAAIVWGALTPPVGIALLLLLHAFG